MIAVPLGRNVYNNISTPKTPRHTLLHTTKVLKKLETLWQLRSATSKRDSTVMLHPMPSPIPVPIQFTGNIAIIPTFYIRGQRVSKM